LHAKLLVCDSAIALITSANFSHHGLHENIEIGVKVTSPAVARLAEFFNSLITAGQVTALAWD
jgi:phosphatidylserine/phosphatidylglycerophosphate/cardiolipin synthase-like enzyme